MALPAKDFIIQQLLEYDPSFDVGAGVPTTHMLIEPMAVILQPIIDEISVIQATKSVLTILESSDPDSFPEDIVDGLASNAFVDRNPGAIGSDVERIRFFEPEDFDAAQGVLIFRGPAGQRYTNSEAVSITSAEMSLNQDGTLFYADVPIIALEEGDDFNVDTGSITEMEAEPAGVANVTNRFGIQDGRDRETNTELIDRIKVAVTVRALVTGRGIIVTLTENFTTIEEIVPIGFGDDEMMRDIVYNVHIGGNCDVYIKVGSLVSGYTDIFNLAVDTSRQKATSATIVALLPSVGYSLNKFPVDRTNVEPVVSTIDGVFIYDDGIDYTISDDFGLFFRLPGSTIYNDNGTNAEVTGEKILKKVGAFATVRSGMILTIDTPGSVAGTYTIKQKIGSDRIEIYGTFPGGGTAATGQLQLAANAADSETVTVGSKVYTFQAVLTDVDGNVLVGATLEDSLANLIAAIDLGPGVGTEYAASMTAHPDVDASVGAVDVMLVTAEVAGVAGNLIVTTETLANGSWGGLSLTGGTGGTISAVDFQVDDNLVVAYEYNPIAVDIIKEARSTAREDYTITDVPLMYIVSVEILDPLSGEPTGTLLDGTGGYGAGGYGVGPYGIGSGTDYKFVVDEPTLRHSEEEDNYLEILSAYIGTAIRVSYYYASAIPPIQAFMNDRGNQSTTASLLARHFIPVFVDGTESIAYEIPTSEEATAISVTAMTTLLKDCIDDIDEADPLEFSDLIDLFYDNGAVMVDLGTLNSLRGEIHNHDGSIEFTFPSDAGVISIPDETIPDPTDKPLSSRIARFLARTITLERTLV